MEGNRKFYQLKGHISIDQIGAFFNFLEENPNHEIANAMKVFLTTIGEQNSETQKVEFGICYKRIDFEVPVSVGQYVDVKELLFDGRTLRLEEQIGDSEIKSVELDFNSRQKIIISARRTHQLKFTPENSRLCFKSGFVTV